MQDIDEVGDNTHDTFFEMLGNWSLGDYFKDEAIAWSYELLTSKAEGFGLDPRRLYITVFEGNEDAPKDMDSFEIWKNLGISEKRIYFLPSKSNWWSAGDNGPCGPDTEMFYDITPEGLGDMPKEEFLKADEEQKVVEIWNDVFMEYEKKSGKVVGKLKNRNVDTGAGLERLAMVLQGKRSIFDTDLFEPIVRVIRENIGIRNERVERIIADHIRTAVFIIADGVTPSNKERGYVLRRLIRRIIQHATNKSFHEKGVQVLVNEVCDIYKLQYPELKEKTEFIANIIINEIIQFKKIQEIGLGILHKKFEERKKELFDSGKVYITLEELEHAGELTAKDLFDLYTTHAMDATIVLEYRDKYYKDLPVEDNIELKLKELMLRHQELSRVGAEQKFKGGLADHSDQTVKLHTAHHLLLAALQKVLGSRVKQKGSSITPERLRMDFSFDRKLTEEELVEVERLVNENIQKGLNVERKEMPKAEAEKIGAEMEFGAKYPDIVSVYSIEDDAGNIISKEFCGGPHSGNTKELGRFKILKEEAVAAGVRRIKAQLL
jgi:alanyl-tRNA synthetase